MSFIDSIKDIIHKLFGQTKKDLYLPERKYQIIIEDVIIEADGVLPIIANGAPVGVEWIKTELVDNINTVIEHGQAVNVPFTIIDLTSGVNPDEFFSIMDFIKQDVNNERQKFLHPEENPAPDPHIRGYL